MTQGSLTGNSIRLTLRKYTSELGWANLAPHDLRRTYARLAHQVRPNFLSCDAGADQFPLLTAKNKAYHVSCESMRS